MKNKEMTYTNNYIDQSRAELLTIIHSKMSEKRFQHTLRVEKVALQLAELHGGDVEKASIAALLHDYAKELPDYVMSDRIITENMDLDMLNYGNAIWHGPVGAVLVNEELGVNDEEILSAIAQHTIGAPKMSLTSQIIFVADYIEPERDFPEVKEARTLAKKSLKQAVFYEMRQTLMHLIKQNKIIYPKSLESYNAWVSRIEKER